MKNIERELLFTKRLKVLISFSVVIVFLVILMFSTGYRLQPNLKIAKDALVKVEIPYSGTAIYLNSIKKYASMKDQEFFDLKLKMKLNKISLQKNGFFVWEKNIYPKSNESMTLKPLLVKSNASGFLIKNTDKEYYDISYKIKESKVPTKENPLQKEDIKIWAEKNTLIAKIKDQEEFGFFESAGDIRSLYFFKDRTDYVIYSADSGVYILEIKQDDDNFQNSFPVYTGKEPKFILNSDKSVYVLDEDVLLEVDI